MRASGIRGAGVWVGMAGGLRFAAVLWVEKGSVDCVGPASTNWEVEAGLTVELGVGVVCSAGARVWVINSSGGSSDTCGLTWIPLAASVNATTVGIYSVGMMVGALDCTTLLQPLEKNSRKIMKKRNVFFFSTLLTLDFIYLTELGLQIINVRVRVDLRACDPLDQFLGFVFAAMAVYIFLQPAQQCREFSAAELVI